MDSEKQHDRFRELVEQSPSMFVIINPDGNIEYINHHVTEVLGFSPEEIIGKPHVFTSSDEKGISHYNRIYDDLTRKGQFSGEIELLKKDGGNIWVRATIAYVFNDNKPVFLVGSMEDISVEVELRRVNRENQAMMKTIMDNVTVSITLMDYNGKITFVNKQAEKNLGLSRELLENKKITELFPAEGPSALKAVQQVFKDKKPVICEISYVIDGKERHFEINRLPLFGPKGVVSYVMSIARDITDVKYAEKLTVIQKEIDSLQSVRNTFQDSLVILFDNLFRLDWVDAGGLYLVNEEDHTLDLVYHRGLSEEFVKNTASYSLDSENARVALLKLPRYVTIDSYLIPSKETVKKEKISFVATLPIVHMDKVLGLLNLASRQVMDIDQTDRQVIEAIANKVGNLVELIKTRNELDLSNSELKTKLEELREKHQMLIQKSRLESLGELSAGLAHEINQPLSIISLAMENINYKLAQEAASREYLEKKFITITQNVNKIRELIDHVRIFSRDQGTIMFEQVDVNLVIRKALSMIGSQLKYHNISVSTVLAEDLGYTLGNPSRLEQVILNLISNARDALEEMADKRENAKYKMEIRIHTSEEDGKILIRVRDNGIGIPYENIPRIFNPFFTTKTARNGTGLGLPIVYGIIREMKGDLTAISEEGQFTEIKIGLPQYKKNVENNSNL